MERILSMSQIEENIRIELLKQAENNSCLTKGEMKVFRKNLNELIEHVRLYGIPNDGTHFVIDKMMFYRLNGIKNRPEFLELAKKLDKYNILF